MKLSSPTSKMFLILETMIAGYAFHFLHLLLQDSNKGRYYLIWEKKYMEEIA